MSEGKTERFSTIAEANSADTVPFINEHLESLKRRIGKYFPNISSEGYE